MCVCVCVHARARVYCMNVGLLMEKKTIIRIDITPRVGAIG